MAEARRVVQVIGSVSPTMGGPAVGSVALNRALRRNGADAVIVSTDLAASGESLDPGQLASMRASGGNVRAYPRSFPVRLENSWKMWPNLFRAVREADFVHIHGQYLAPCVAAYFASRIYQKPFGIQPHGGLERYQRNFSKGRKRVYNALIGSRILRQASYVLFASESEAASAADVVSPAQSRVHALGAELDSAETDPALEARLADVERDRVVVFLGRLASKKRPELLVRAWAETRASQAGCVLVVAGPDGDVSVDDLSQLASDLNVTESVYFAGRVEGGRKSYLLSRASIFCLPSENENFGIAVVEAMLAGVAVLTTKDVAAGVYVEGAHGGRVVSTSVSHDDLAAEIDALLDHPTETRAMGIRNRRLATEELSWDSLALYLVEQGIQARQDSKATKS